MLRVLDIRLATSGGFLAAVRRIEYLVLLAFCGYVGMLYAPYGILAAMPLLLLALMLVPGKDTSAVTREKERLTAVHDLQDAGYQLHTRWLDVADLPLTDSVALQQWTVRRDTLIWMSRCESRLAGWPEFAGIFVGHEHKPDVMEELDECLLTLSRLRRLSDLSRSLKLPI